MSKFWDTIWWIGVLILLGLVIAYGIWINFFYESLF